MAGTDTATDGGTDRIDPRETHRYREGEDGDPIYVRDEDMGIGVEWERPEGGDPSDATVTYYEKGGVGDNSITISPGDTILGPDGEDVVTVTGFCVTVGPWLSVETYVDLPPEQGGGVPNGPHAFAIRWLGYEDNDGYHYHMGDCVAAQGEELERERWADELETLRSLEGGDRIRWDGRSEPLTVNGPVLTLSQWVQVEGPRGGVYVIEWEQGGPTVRRERTDGPSLGRPDGLEVVERSGGDA